MRWAGALLLLLLVSVTAFAALGVFRGKLVDPPSPQGRAGWIFVQSPRGTLRQVEISKATIVYGEDVPAADRSSSPNTDLVPGAEVLVAAEQDNAGEWRATEVQILTLRSGRGSPRPAPGRVAAAH